MVTPRENRYTLRSAVLSGIESEPKTPARGIVIALHGSGYTGRYWDCPHEESNSLLRLGSELGYRVIAVDRPGYGTSRQTVEQELGLDAQTELLGELISHVNTGPKLLPVFLIGHSLGGLLAVRLAAQTKEGAVSGIDLVGLPVKWRNDVREAVELAVTGTSAPLDGAAKRLAMYFGPTGTYDPKIIELERSFSQRIPLLEVQESLESARILRQFSSRVRVPVQYTSAEFDGSIAGGSDVIATGKALFTGSPHVVAHLQINTGHNVSLHRVGRAYHLRAFAFFDEILVSRADHADHRRRAGDSLPTSFQCF